MQRLGLLLCGLPVLSWAVSLERNADEKARALREDKLRQLNEARTLGFLTDEEVGSATARLGGRPSSPLSSTSDLTRNPPGIAEKPSAGLVEKGQDVLKRQDGMTSHLKQLKESNPRKPAEQEVFPAITLQPALSLKPEDDVFVIGSCIHTVNKRLHYTRIRSAFDAPTRLKQTLETIASIRSKKPRAKIILLELSKLEPGEQKALAAQVDHVANLDSIPGVAQLRDGPAKSMAEAYAYRLAAQHLEPFRFHMMYKISGRYHLNDKFDDKKFDSRKMNFHLDRNGRWAQTMLYGIPKDMWGKYTGMLDHALTFRKKSEKSELAIEQILIDKVDAHDLNNIPSIGVSGRFGPWGGHVSTDLERVADH